MAGGARRSSGPGAAFAWIVLVAAAAGCGYTVSARPALAGGVGAVAVPVLENDTPEAEVGVLMATALARRAESDGRLAGRGEPAGRLLGRVETVSASPAAFPGAVGQAGMYAVTLRVRLRLLASEAGPQVTEVVVTGREPFLAGRTPEETEAYRRLALERLTARLADEAWSELTAPQAP
jgi:hypothetical protein